MTLNRATKRPAIRSAQWNHLINALVEIRQNGNVIRTGYVEAAMTDSSALWIAADANSPRQMFETSEDHEVWVAPQQLSGDLSYRMTTNQILATTPSTRIAL